MADDRLNPARTLVIPDNAYANLYLIIYDLNSGDMLNKTTGAVTAVWAEAALAGAKHATNLGVWLFVIPQIKNNINLGINFYENGTPVDNDAVKASVKYDSKKNSTYSDANCTAQGRTFTR